MKVEIIKPVPKEAPSPFINGRGTVLCASKGTLWDLRPKYIWEWIDKDGSKIGYVVRTTDKKILTIFYCQTSEGKQWCQMGYGTNKPLFNLQSLDDKDTVWVLEGELTCMKVQKLLTDVAAVCNQGGASHVNVSDWTPLYGKNIIIVPDNDEPGIKAANQIAEKLEKHCPSVQIVLPPENKKKGWDLADAIEEGWKVGQIKNYIKNNSKPFHLGRNKEQKENSIAHVVRPLGVNRDRFFYLPQEQGQVISLTAQQHTSRNLMGLAPLKFWEYNFHKENSRAETPVNWSVAIDTLMQECREKGIFDEKKCRGRGCFNDEGKIVFHAGDKLIVDGQEIDIFDFESNYIYERGQKIDLDFSRPLEDEESQNIIEAACLANWEESCSANLLAGWIALAPISGCLRWRPQMWITGPAGSGKSTVLSDLCQSLLKNIVVQILGGSTESGTRQYVKKDAFPITYDESEPEGKRGKARNDALLFLVRAATSDTGALILKGTTSHKSEGFEIRSMFLFSSTVISLEHQADKTRFAILTLESESNRESGFDYTPFVQASNEFLEEGFSSKLIARSIKLAKTIKKNAETLSSLISSKYGSKRFGDQYGYLIAGCESLKHSREISEEEAISIVSEYNLEAYKESLDSSQELDLLSKIMQIRIKAGVSVSAEELTIGQCLKKLRDLITTLDSIEVSEKVLKEKLRSVGIKYVGRSDEQKFIHISTKSNLIQKHLEGSSTPVNWHKILLRLPGAKNITSYFGPEFGGADRTRAVSLPMDILFKNEEEWNL